MNDPFYNIYSIIENHHKGKLISSHFNSLGSNNPNDLIRGKSSYNEIQNIQDYFNNLSHQFVVLHDQEPILFSKQLSGWKNVKRAFNRLRNDHILSNSELNSNEKDLFLKFTGWQDFYWFSNGFLALEWYRQFRYATYLETSFTPTYHFSSYNRLIDSRIHRLILSGLLLSFDSKVILSCETIDPTTKKSVSDIFKTTNIPTQYHEYFNNIVNYGKNIKINTVDHGGQNQAFDIDLIDFQDSFCHIITERIFFEDRIHLTERSFRPIVCCRPFILASSPGSLQYLQKYGFQTFGKFWDESYDNEHNHFKRLDKIINVIKKLEQLSISELHNMLNEMRPILLHNRNHFYNSFHNIITTEMLSNLNKVVANKNPRDGNLYQIINSLSSEQIKILEENDEYESLEFPSPFNQYEFLNLLPAERDRLFKDHEKYFRLVYKITKLK